MFSRIGHSVSPFQHSYHSCRSNRRSSIGETTRHIVPSWVRASSPKQDGVLDVHLRKMENAGNRQKPARDHSFNGVRLKLTRSSLQRLGLDPKRGSSGISAADGSQDLGVLKPSEYRRRSFSEGVTEPREGCRMLLAGLVAQHPQPTQAKQMTRVSRNTMLALFALAVAILAMIAKSQAARSVDMEQNPRRLPSPSDTSRERRSTLSSFTGLGRSSHSGSLSLLPRDRDLDETAFEKDTRFPGNSEDHICRH